MPTLSHATRQYRRNLMNDLMDRTRVDALVFTAADFFQWATNFHVDVQTWERPIAICVPRNGEPFAVMNELSTHHLMMARERGHLWLDLDRVTLYAEHPRVTQRQPLLAEVPALIADTLRTAGLAGSRIGVDAAGGPLARAGALLPDAKLVPMLAEMRALRWVKHDEEIAIMRAAAELADWVQDRYRENIRPGRLVQELDYSMAALMVTEGAKRFPGENLEVMRCWTLSGPASASPHGDGASCGARISEGDGMVNIVIPRLNGLVIENERTWFCGKPSSEQARFYEVARAANEAAVNAAVTGKPVSGIDAAAQAVIEKAGCGEYIRHRTGHGMGIIGHEYPDDMAFNHRPLLANEVYSAEPGIYVYGLGGFRLDDSVVTGDTPVMLTNTPRTLAHATID
ncbi:M24 family metallopeptidase [Pandoraea apista]|uniref:M24 family metallopeptidase n=1 Tax=Pandoraea apista TaxID=93218 RepID=UPI00058AA109|nr:Xaa-Pro peptidase family protein [Pandoraea apista]AJF00701.1 aminopeptidase [Pandoraea apista]AKH74900.1 aminopeptidase [Pandoraea apista]AKI65036.1 aminopeptidase [Pandoraea apista]AVF42867.1 aminopeptidase P family protein [Pandoraea apista]